MPPLLPQIVILVQVLSHEINHGYKYTVTPCHSFNDTKVGGAAHPARAPAAQQASR